jgi:hypothetical protein
MGKTVIWVKGEVLAEAFGKAKKSHKKNQINLDRGGGAWAWSRCSLDSGDLSALDGGLGVTVYDDASEFNGQSTTISGGVAKPDASGSKVVMANDFTAAEVNGEEVGSTPDDLITLTHLHEPSVIYCLRKRYSEDQVYTATGPILIALNPFKKLPGLYDDIMMNDHWMAGEGVANLSLKPHIFQNAHAAFRAMMQGIDMQQTGMQDAISDQSMLVSGESGAGKTVTTKFVMKYLASLSQRKADFAKRRRDASPGRSEPTGPRRSSMRASRAMSWKAGALVEERSTYIVMFVVLVLLQVTSLTHRFIVAQSWSRILSWRRSETLELFVTITRRVLENLSNSSSSKQDRWWEQRSRPIYWRRFVLFTSQKAKETTISFTSCFLRPRMRNERI